MPQPLIRFLIAASLAATCGAGLARADDDYLSDALKKPAYRKAWNAMLAGEKNIPDWLITFGRGGSGVNGPVKPVTVDGRKMQASFVCKPHDCASNQLQILFSLDASSAVAILKVDDRPRYLGAPTPAQRAALDRAE